jgi:Glycosyltransferase family 87
VKRALLTALAALAAIYALVVVWRENERAAGLDFYVYYVNSQLAQRADVEDIYSAEVQERIGEEFYARAQTSGSELRKYDAQRRRRMDSVSSPFLYTALSWVSRDYDFALQQYHALVLSAFTIGFLLIARRARLPWYAALLMLAALLLWYRGFEADIRVGNVNSLQLLALGVFLWSPPLLGGAVLAMLLAFKPTLLYVVLLLAFARLAARDWPRLKKEFAGGAIGAIAAIVITAVHYRGFDVWLEWIGAANQFFHRLQTRAERNVAPFLEWYQQHGAAWSHVITLVLLAAVCIILWRNRQHVDDLLVIGLAIAVYLIASPVVWLHYMVLVVPLALALVKTRITAAIASLALAAIAEEPYEWIARAPIYPNDAMLIAPALIALFLCGVYALHRNPATAAR